MKNWFVLSLCLFFCFSLSAQKRVKVACVGNSITYGSGLVNRETESYPVRLQQMLGDRYEVKNFGKPGATLLNQGHRPYMQQQEYQDAIAFAGDIVVVHLGINDTDPRNWPNYRDVFIKDYVALIDSFRAVNPTAKIIISRLTPIADRHPRFLSGTRDWHGEIQLAIDEIANYTGVQLIDFHEVLYPYPFLLPDAIHPSAEGANKMAQTVFSAITGNFGGLKLSMLYTDNMVLQRNTPLDIHGIANAGERVTVCIANQKLSTTTGTNGKWSVRLLPLKAGGPYLLTIATKQCSKQYSNVLVGEVWLCSGQSNMEFMLRDASTGRVDMTKAGDEQLRLFNMQARWRTNAEEWDVAVLDSLNHLKHYKKTSWESCKPENAGEFSAIAYYFGKMLRDSLQVPIGLICNAVGGSTTESWIDRRSLEYQFPEILRDWLHNDFIQDWARERAALNIRKAKEKYQRHPYEPCYLYESGILPLDQYPIKGVIWYQGESNAHNWATHERLFKLLVNGWRKNWDNASMPFYYVQLSSLNRPSWTWFRDSQRRLMAELPFTGMAVSSDQGDSLNVHPIFKKPIGERLAHWALNKTYAMSTLLPSGPLFRSADYQEGAVYLTVDYGQGMKSSNGMPLRGFEVAETDGFYFPAKAEVVGHRLKVMSEQIKRPRYVRYGWQPFTRANLINEAGLPASTFRAEALAPLVQQLRVQKMSGFPKNEKGIEQGVSACFAGVLNGQLLIAGGCNFPDIPVEKGGKKKYYQGIYATDFYTDSLFSWRKVGELPVPLAYGVSVSTVDGIICVGGVNEKGSKDAVFQIRWKEGQKKVQIEQLPSLPYALDNLTGALVGNQLFVAGGNRGGKPSNTFLCLNLERLFDGWKTLSSFPGPARIQPVSAGQNKEGELCFYLWGGFASATDTQPASLSVDGYCYTPSSETWTKVSTSVGRDRNEISLGGGTSIALGDNQILCMGGVHKEIFLSALLKPIEGYLLHPAEWYQFNQKMLVYDTRSDCWQEIYTDSVIARAGAALVGDGKIFYSINGELKPGIRTPEILRIVIE